MVLAKVKKNGIPVKTGKIPCLEITKAAIVQEIFNILPLTLAIYFNVMKKGESKCHEKR